MSARRVSLGFAFLAALAAVGAFAAGPTNGAPREKEKALKLTPEKPPPSHGGVEGVTRCELCHSTAGWANARFAHERTGFPLVGAHQKAQCKACHPNTFTEPLGQLCSGCHRDPHRGEFGARCEGCHDAQSWRTAFTADAHRRTAFPLDGRHALIPCTECHGEMRDRAFSRPVAGCYSCHANDYANAGRAGGLDHQVMGLGTQCQQCHSGFRFEPAKFPQHDRCFPITTGSHSNIPCLGCHTATPNSPAAGACATNTAACTACHEHACARSDEEHKEVFGYQCKDRKCYECHQSGGAR